jgi:hypothetical protein
VAISSLAKSSFSTFDKFQKTSAGNTPAVGVLVMAGNNTSASNYATSTDGATWTLRTGTGMGQSWGLYKIGSAFQNIAGGAGNVVTTTLDPVNGPVTTGGSRLAIATADASGTNGVIYTNNNFVMWNEWGWHFGGFGRGTGGVSTAYSSFVYGNGTWVIVTAGAITYSVASAEKYPAGLTFTSATSAVTTPHRVFFANNLFVCTGSDGIATSSNGITWTKRSSAGDFRFGRVIYAGGVWFASISAGSFYTSLDATTWTARTAMAGAYLVGATYGNGVYCVLTSTGALYSSADAVTWTSRTNPVTGTNWPSDLSNPGGSVLAFG